MVNVKNKFAEGNHPTEEWFISMFLRSLELEKQLKWWRYPSLNIGLNIPFCWLFLSIGCLANFNVIFSPEFFEILQNSLFAKYSAILFFGLLNCFAVAGLWMEFPFFLLPMMTFYVAFSSATFLYLICSLPALIYLDEPFAEYYLLAPLLPLNILTSKSLFEVFLLFQTRRNGREQNNNKLKKNASSIIEKKKQKNGRNKKYWIDQLQKKMENEKENYEEEYCSRILMDAGKRYTNRRKNGEENANISEFYGQIAERKINLKEEKSTAAEIVQMPNGEVRRRRFKKKKKLVEKRKSQERELLIPLMMMDKNNESSTTTMEFGQQKMNGNEHQNYQQIPPNGMGKEPQGKMTVEENKCKKPPIPRPRTSHPMPNNFGIGQTKMPLNQLTSPTTPINNFIEFCRETEV